MWRGSFYILEKTFITWLDYYKVTGTLNSSLCMRWLLQICLVNKKQWMCSTFSLNLVSLSSLHICTTSLKSINLHLPLRPFFTVAETRLHHSCLLLPGKLSSLHSPIHLQPLEGKASAAATAVAKAVFFLLLPHELPPLKHTHTVTTIDLLNSHNNYHAWMQSQSRGPIQIQCLFWTLARKLRVDRQKKRERG